MKKTLFLILCIFALIIGAYPLMYALVEPKNTFLSSKSPELLASIVWKTAFFAHIIFGGISLFIGWRQFGSKFRQRYLRLHKIIGWIYATSVFISSLSAIYLGVFSNGGLITSLGFIFLGMAWFVTTFYSVIAIRKGNIVRHRQLMIYSYACTFAAVTLRLWYPLLSKTTENPELSYTLVSWLCWIPNVCVAYFINKQNYTEFVISTSSKSSDS